jgi:hypothetical protein
MGGSAFAGLASASAPLPGVALPRASSSGSAQNGGSGGFPPQYAQQLQNQLLLQQGGAFPFLPPGELLSFLAACDNPGCWEAFEGGLRVAKD